MVRILIGLVCFLCVAGSVRAAEDALDEVNAKRAAYGLPPFIYDEGLTQAAMGCADYRAYYLMTDHTSNDFAFIPQWSYRARAAGCAAWPAHLGWGSCCTLENWRYAGAAYTIGRDGRRYMSLFVR